MSRNKETKLLEIKSKSVQDPRANKHRGKGHKTHNKNHGYNVTKLKAKKCSNR